MARKRMPLVGNPIPLNAPAPTYPATRVVWAAGRARVVSELTPAQAAAIFERWGVDAVISEGLCGAPPPAPADHALDKVRALAARPQFYPYVGEYEARTYADEPLPSLTDLLLRLERNKLVEPSRPWWARAFERLVARYGEDTIIIAALSGVVAVYFAGSVLWRLAATSYGGAA